MNVGSNEYVAAASFLTCHDDKIEESDKQDIVTNIKFDAIVPSIKNQLFNQFMVDFMN